MNLDKKAYEKTLRKIGENHINVGSGDEISIFELCKLLKKISKFEGKIVFNKNNLDGVTSKVLDSTNMKALGWNTNISIEEGLKKSLMDGLAKTIKILQENNLEKESYFYV